MTTRILGGLCLVAASVEAQGWRLTGPESATAGDVVALRLTRDGAPQAGVALRVAAPAREIGVVRAAAVEVRDAPSPEGAVTGALFRGDLALVTVRTNADEWCGVLTGFGLSGHVLCSALNVRAFGQPLGSTDADGRVLSRDLAAVAATIEVVAERAGEALATFTLTVKPEEFDISSPLAPGVTLRERRWAKPGDGIFTMRAMEVDPAAPHLFLLPARANDRAIGTELTSLIARRHGALAAINASPFIRQGAYEGAVDGHYQWNGVLMGASGGVRPALLLCDPQSRVKADVDQVEFRGRVTAGSGALDLNGLNRPRGADELVLYTPWMAPRTRTGVEDSVEAVLDPQGRVSEVREGDSEIPADGVVVSGSGAAGAFLRQQATVGTLLRIEAALTPSTTPALTGCQAADVVGGVAEPEPGRAPRTAFAVTDRNTWLLVTVDGRQPGASGLRPAELAEELAAMGAVKWVELDGGASSVMVANDVVRNAPAAGEELPVGDALLLFSVQDMVGLRFVVDRVTNTPGQVPFDLTLRIQESIAAGLTAIDAGEPAALRAAMERLRNDLLRAMGRELPAMPGRVLLRAVEAFILTLPAIQPPPDDR